MKIRYLKEHFFEDLLTNVKKNERKYLEVKPWIDSYYEGKDYYNESSININEFILYSDKSIDEEKNDLVNTRILYNSLKNLTLMQATNPYMWTFFAHTFGWEYMINRWSVDDGRSIVGRYFCKSNRRSLMRNGISRLWWYGYLTYVENSKNPYELTETLLLDADLCTSIIERDFSMIKNVTKGILIAMKYFYDNEGALPPREIRRKAMKYLNNYGGVTMLETLETEEVTDLVKNYIKKLEK